MKIKGITFWEQHLEKIVVGLAVVVFIGFAALQFIRNPSEQSASGAPNGKVDARNVDAYLQKRAQDLLEKVQAPNPPEPLPQYTSLTTDFQKLIAGANFPDAPLPPIAYVMTLPVHGSTGASDKPYAVPQLEAPEMVAVGHYADALLPETVQAVPALAALFPDGKEPFDLSWSTPRGRFNLGKVVRQFKGDELPPDQAGHAPVPTPWHNDRGLILDVVAEREELVDGQFTDRVVLDPLPGNIQLSFRSKLNAGLKAAERDAMLTEVMIPERQLAVIQPEFYPTRRNIWHVPQPIVAAQPGDVEAGVDPEVFQLRGKLLSQKQERERINKKLTELGGPAQDPADKDKGKGDKGDKSGKPPKDGPPRPSGGSGGDESGGKRRGGDRPPVPPPPGLGGGGGSSLGTGEDAGKRTGAGGSDEKNLAARITWTKKLALQEKRIANTQAALDALTGGAPKPDDQPDKAVAVTDDGFVDVWVHDITAMPGHTYRYRLQVKVYNPFFGKKLNLMEAQRNLADRITLDSPLSDWSENKFITPWVQLYLTSAKAANQADAVVGPRFPLGQASFEVYRFYDGTWLKQRFGVAPGDRVGKREERDGDGEQKLEVDFTTPFYVVDVAEDVGTATASSRESRGPEAMVLIQDLEGSKPLQVRRPKDDLADPDRAWLEEQVQLAREELVEPPPAPK